MVTVKEILGYLNELAPMERKMDFDNVGLLVGWPDNAVTKVVTALDITNQVIDEAVTAGAELIVSHHPLIFTPQKHVRADDLCGMKILSLAKNGISAICMHTNLDVSRGGVNDILAQKLGILQTSSLIADGFDATGEDYGLGRVGELPGESTLQSFLTEVKTALKANGLRYSDAGKQVHRVAVCGGSGGSELMTALNAGCDTYVTADVKYNAFLDAAELGINLIDAGHFPTENAVIVPLTEKLTIKFPEVKFKISCLHSQPEKFF